MTDARPYTEEEVRARFLDYMWVMVKYWNGLPNRTPTERLEGLMHGTLSVLDGCADGICGFKVIPCPDKDDKAFHRSQGENWYPDNIDIAGSLHTLVYEPRSLDLPPDR